KKTRGCIPPHLRCEGKRPRSCDSPPLTARLLPRCTLLNLECRAALLTELESRMTAAFHARAS
ncbi:MAG: hypothetical protein MUC50_23925, partial [Myxococcota bacterium]|nr:hypothetical protein [Myxococcota bacterium]